MKVLSWNINGLRASLRNFAGPDLKSLLDSLEADIICIQETKATRVRPPPPNIFNSEVIMYVIIKGDQLDESLYMADGYNGYFSFCRTKKGYSGKDNCLLYKPTSIGVQFLQPQLLAHYVATPYYSLESLLRLTTPIYLGVVTFCRNSVSPSRAEEGLTGVLSSGRKDAVENYGDHTHSTIEEVIHGTSQAGFCPFREVGPYQK